MSNKNPLKVILKAITVKGQRVDSTTNGSGDTVKNQLVDISPLRSINIGIYLITFGAREAYFRTSKNIV